MRDQTYSKRLIKCWAVIDNEEYDVVQVSFDFALNSIPTASATIALGRDVNQTESYSYVGRAAKINEKFLFRRPIKILASYILQDETPDLAEFDAAVPEFRNKLIFDGYVAGFGFQRTPTGSVLSISIEHWLSDLAASSMLGAGTHYSTPADLQRSVVLEHPDLTQKRQLQAAGDQPSDGDNTFMGNSWFTQSIDSYAAVIDDLWENGIKMMMTASAKTDHLIDINQLVQTEDCPYSNKFNEAALGALAKTTSTKTPLAIRPLTSDPTDIAKNIINDLSKNYLENLAGQNMWDNLINTSADLMYAVIPHIESAEVVPFCPTTTDDFPFATIPANQIDSISISGDCPRVIRGVGIVYKQSDLVVGNASLDSGAAADSPVISGGFGLAGTYINNSLGCNGSVLFKHPPLWLGTDYTGWGTDGQMANDIPNTANPEPKGNDEVQQGKSVETARADMTSAADAYAKALYGHEVIKGRQGTISGPLRFDIGVGSLVEFELPEDYHTPSSAENRYFYGLVIRVSSVLDSNSSAASTTFTVAHIRTYAEEFNANFMLDYHPIYENKWVGARLDEGVPNGQ